MGIAQIHAHLMDRYDRGFAGLITECDLVVGLSHDRFAGLEEGFEWDRMSQVLLHESGLQLLHSFYQSSHPLILERHE